MQNIFVFGTSAYHTSFSEQHSVFVQGCYKHLPTGSRASREISFRSRLGLNKVMNQGRSYCRISDTGPQHVSNFFSESGIEYYSNSSLNYASCRNKVSLASSHWFPPSEAPPPPTQLSTQYQAQLLPDMERRDLTGSQPPDKSKRSKFLRRHCICYLYLSMSILRNYSRNKYF
ncbi:hypothetical protein TNCV_5105241 [Trichonephila clavipes]|nr:hypothetical protein TNCV_5105241 [Trichonephila clavipes]